MFWQMLADPMVGSGPGHPPPAMQSPTKLGRHLLVVPPPFEHPMPYAGVSFDEPVQANEAEDVPSK
jgi:hypothetical protein